LIAGWLAFLGGNARSIRIRPTATTSPPAVAPAAGEAGGGVITACRMAANLTASHCGAGCVVAAPARRWHVPPGVFRGDAAPATIVLPLARDLQKLSVRRDAISFEPKAFVSGRGRGESFPVP